ncbi:uncharacterized protein G2W53_001204 [Senna tora]|uniref:Uncharacterized protein n=1 Tax=Senna tora TaxID=362788 RepID=A0A834XFH3_9FABA|nr:uncharacterized protein G2W53_001204 [Senna tora]
MAEWETKSYLRECQMLICGFELKLPLEMRKGQTVYQNKEKGKVSHGQEGNEKKNKGRKCSA